MALTSHEHATGLVRAFFQRSRRGRYLALLASGSQGRTKFRRALAHLRDLDDRFVRPIPSGPLEQTVLKVLRELGAPETCYVLSERDDLDDRELELEDALDSIIGHGAGALLSCIPGRLAYFEGEGPGDRCVLYRSGSQ